MSENLDEMSKDSFNDEAADTRTTRSDELPNRGKERRKLSKKKMFRSAKRRLSGGADAESGSPDPAAAKSEEEHPAEADGSAVRVGDSTGAVEEFFEGPQERQPLTSTGDPRVDEMLECALTNLDEAAKALTSLSENLDHDLKLFLIEVMSRTRKWTSHVETKVEWARKDILELHKELAKNMLALADSRRESADLKSKLQQSDDYCKAVMSGENRAKFQVEDTSTQTGGKLSGAKSSTSVCSKNMSLSPHDEEERLRSCCAELEAEVLELRKENERIVKERADYENAIQRALLKGVSSLNVEALKVLRCTPIPTCCPPSGSPPGGTMEPMSKRDCNNTSKSSPRGGCGGGGGNGGCGGGGGNGGCGGGTARSGGNGGCGGGNRGHRNGAGGSGSREALNAMMGMMGSMGGATTKRVCPSAGHSEKRNKKSKDNMLLLLHQKDAENFGINSGSNYCDNATKKQTICGGGNCGKNGKSSSYMC